MKKCKEAFPGLPEPVFHPAGNALPRPSPLPRRFGSPLGAPLGLGRGLGLGTLRPLARWWPLCRWLLLASLGAVFLALIIFFIARGGASDGVTKIHIPTKDVHIKEPPTGDWSSAEEMPESSHGEEDGRDETKLPPGPGDPGPPEDEASSGVEVAPSSGVPSERPSLSFDADGAEAGGSDADQAKDSAAPVPDATTPSTTSTTTIASGSNTTAAPATLSGGVLKSATNQSHAESSGSKADDDDEEMVYDTDELVIDGDDGDAEYEGDTDQTLPEFLESILSLWSSPAPPVLNGHRYGDIQAGDQWPVASSSSPAPSTRPSTRPPVPVVSPTLPPRLSLVHRVTPTPSPEPPADDDCESPRLPLCRGLLPYDLTLARPSVPQVPALRTAADLSAALPYFELVAQSGCSARVRAFLCPLLEPECVPRTAQPRRPCRRLCRAVAEDCQDFILNNLDLSRVFDCSHYPDSPHGEDCLDLSAGGSCLPREFSCGDGTCIPQRWLCDGRVDCSQGADERNCSAVCPDDHFRCASSGASGSGPGGVSCVRALLRCDGRQDCADGSDEVGCAANTGGADAAPAVNATLERK